MFLLSRIRVSISNPTSIMKLIGSTDSVLKWIQSIWPLSYDGLNGVLFTLYRVSLQSQVYDENVFTWNTRMGYS